MQTGASASSGADFNPRSPWGERPARCSSVLRPSRISIHAPRGGSDSFIIAPSLLGGDFNPRSPWGERLWFPIKFTFSHRFQSTLPVGGATKWARNRLFIFIFQSTLPVGGATILFSSLYEYIVFQSTLPVGGATCFVDRCYRLILISIHAPRGGSDSKDAQFYLRIFGEKVNFECDFLVNSRCQPVS